MLLLLARQRLRGHNLPLPLLTPRHCRPRPDVLLSRLLSSPAADLLEEPDVELLQNMSCKVDAATLKPAEYPENPEMEW